MWRIADSEATRCETADEVEAIWTPRQIQEWCELQKMKQEELDAMHRDNDFGGGDV